MSDKEMMELLEIYMDMYDKQEEMILQMAALIKKQAEQIRHMQSVYGFFEEDPG